MTDKVQKIKEWISKTQDGLMDDNGNFENASNEGAFHILSNLDYYIDSLQEGHRPQFKVGDTIRSKVWESAVHKIVYMDDSAYFFENGGMVRFDNQEQWELAEETVSEDLEKELPKIWDRETLDEYAYQVAYDLSNDWMRETPTWDDVETAVKLGAKWQKGKDKKEWMDKALDFFGSNYNSLIDGGVIGVFDDKKKMIEEFVEFMNNENL